MADNEINVNLKLNAAGVGKEAAEQVSKDFEAVNKKLGGTMAGAFSDSFKKLNPHLFEQAGRAAAMDFAKGFKNVLWSSKSILQQQKPMLPGFMQDPGFFTRGRVAEKEAERSLRDSERRNLRFMRLTESMTKNYSMLSGVVFNPLGGLTTMFSARQVFEARRRQSERSKLGGGEGESITASVLMAGGLGLLATGAGLALKGLGALAQQIAQAFADSKKRYVGGALSGFGTKGFTTREVIGKILGVSPDDIYKFGDMTGFLKARLDGAISSMAANARVIAEANIEWEILKVKIEAIAVDIAAQLAPALTLLGVVIEFLLNKMKFLIEFFKMQISTSLLGLLFKPGVGGGGGSMPALQPQMKQMPASTWERMGLVLGGTGASNYGKQTADNTKRTAKAVEALLIKFGVNLGISTATSFALP